MKLKELYLGSCLKDLTAMGENIEQKAYPKILLKSMDKLLAAAKESEMDGDQEKAYVLMIRYCTIFQVIIKSRDYSIHKTYYDSMLNRKVIAGVMDSIGKLQTRLLERFEEREAKALLERTSKLRVRADSEGKQVAPERPQPEPKDQPRSRGSEERESKPAWISVNAFAEVIRSPAATTGPQRPIVFDVRPERLSGVSSLKFDRIIAVPPGALHEGCTVSHLSRLLQDKPEALSLFQERGQARQIFLMDEDSSAPGSAPLLRLKAALFQWDAAELVRAEPVAVDGGFSKLLEYYPTLVSNVHAYRDLLKSSATAKGRSGADAVSIQYPDLDARQRKKKEEEEAARRRKEEEEAARRRKKEEEAAARRRKEEEEEARRWEQLEDSRRRQDSAMEAERRRRLALREQQEAAEEEGADSATVSSLMQQEREKNKQRQMNGDAPPEVNRKLKPAPEAARVEAERAKPEAPAVNRQLKPNGVVGRESEEPSSVSSRSARSTAVSGQDERSAAAVSVNGEAKTKAKAKTVASTVVHPEPEPPRAVPKPSSAASTSQRPVITPTPSVSLSDKPATTPQGRLSNLQSTHARDRLSFAAKGGAKLTVEQRPGESTTSPGGGPDADVASLPAGWERHFDLRSNRYYYVDLTSQTTTWSGPWRAADEAAEDVDGPAQSSKPPAPNAAFRVVKAPLRDQDEGSSSSWSSGSGKLKRSSSQPNLAPTAGRGAEEGVDAEMSAGATAALPRQLPGSPGVQRFLETPISPTSSSSSSGKRGHPDSTSTTWSQDDSPGRLPPMPSRDTKPRFPSGASEAEIMHMDSVQLTHMRPEYGNTTPGLTGLRNLGNSCYMNSVLQALANTRHLVQYIQKDAYRLDINRSNPAGHRGEIAEEFAIIIKTLWNGRYRTISPSKFKQTVSRHNSMFASNEQQDSQEFLLFLLDGLHEDFNSAAKKKGQKPPPELEDANLSCEKRAIYAWNWHKQLNESFIVEMFQGQFKSTVRCLTCRYESTTFDVFMYLSLQIPTGMRSQSANYPTLMDCVDQFVKEEKMTGSSQWHCSRCKTNRDAVKKIDIWRLPPYLLIHLKRFSYDNSLRQKMNTMVHFPLHGLEMEQGGKRPNQKSNHPSTRVYELYAVSNHYGSMESGHYTAFCMNRSTQKWHKFDDELVTPIPSNKIRSPAAYILFYAEEAPVNRL